MAEAINITCTQCGNASRVPAEAEGKKIRCKQCNAVFVVKSNPKPAATPAAAKPPAAKAPSPKAPAANAPAAKPPVKAVQAKVVAKKVEDEYEAAKNPYIMREENLAARCPFCAMSLDPPDSRICLHCGYDMQKRKRVESKKTYEITAGDYFMYHLPTILCFIGFCILITIDVLSLIFAEDIMEGSWFEEEQGKYLVKPGIIPLYVTLISLIGIVPCVKKIVTRLINFTPPEVIKRDTEGEDN